MYKRFFEDAGFAVHTADSFPSAIQLIEREFFHVAAVDLSLFGEKNRDGLKIVRKFYHELKEGTEAVLLSAYGTMEIGADAKEYGAFGIIEKKSVTSVDFTTVAEKAYKKSLETLSHYNLGFGFLAGPRDPQESQAWTSHVIGSLGSGGVEALNTITKPLLANLYPLLRYASKPQADLVKEAQLASGTYWSKMLGKAIMVQIGPADVIARREADIRAAAGAAEEESAAILKVLTRGRIAGIVLSLRELGREAFEFNHGHDVAIGYPRS